VCSNPKDSSVEETFEPEIKITVMVVKVQGLPADKVPFEDRTLALSCQTGVDTVQKRMTNVIDPFFNHEFETQPGVLEFKVMEEHEGGEPTCLGQATLDATNLDSYVGNIPLEGGSAVITVKVKGKGCEYPEDSAMAEYQVRIDNPKKTKSLGLELDSTDGTCCYVTSVKASSLVDKHNKSAEESNQLLSGAYIVAYNGVSDKPQAIESEMKKAAPTAEFTLRPMQMFRICIDRSTGDALGIDIPAKPVGNSVLVKEVKDQGFVANWNAANPDQEIKNGDRIIEVNGKKGKAKQLIDFIKKAPKTERVVLTITRMAPQSGQ